MGLKKKEGIDFVKRWVKNTDGLCRIYPRKDNRSGAFGIYGFMAFADMYGFEPKENRWTPFYIIKE